MATHKQQAGLIWPDARVVMQHVDVLVERFDLAIRDAYNLYFHVDCSLSAAIAWQEAHVSKKPPGVPHRY